MKKLFAYLTLTVLFTVGLFVVMPQADAKPVWFRWNGFVVIDHKYVGKKLAEPLPAGVPVIVRVKPPRNVSDTWVDGYTYRCFDRWRGDQFNYSLSLNGWLCVNARNVR
jgi:hypothetical protein